MSNSFIKTTSLIQIVFRHPQVVVSNNTKKHIPKTELKLKLVLNRNAFKI